jgi:hypothetical protein
MYNDFVTYVELIIPKKILISRCTLHSPKEGEQRKGWAKSLA